MNQHDQMREALRKLKSEERVRTFAEAQYWLTQYKLFAEQLLEAEPAPLVRLTDYQVFLAVGKMSLQQQVTDDFILSTANAIMDAMERANK